MAEQVLMPKQGNTVESCVILSWRKKEGDRVEKGDVLCDIETDKAAFEVESTSSGSLLKVFFKEGDDVPVLTPIAVVGSAGEDISSLASGPGAQAIPQPSAQVAPLPAAQTAQADQGSGTRTASRGNIRVSPRAKKLAGQKAVDLRALAGNGSGPGGRIIERDVRALLDSGGSLTAAAPAAGYPGETREYRLTGVRKLVAERMFSSLQNSAQLTMHACADARVILDYRRKLKQSPEELGLREITINDLVLYATVKTLTRYPALNSHFLGDRIVAFKSVHAAFAVDTDRGLMVPVIRFADRLNLKQLAGETKRLGTLCIEGGINPDELSGGSVTVTNLGAMGIEMFTPVLNPPQTAIIGVCTIGPKAVIEQGDTVFRPHIGLSLTINHQAVDGGPAARFLKELCDAIANFELTLAE